MCFGAGVGTIRRMEPNASQAVRALRANARGHLMLDESRRLEVRYVWDRRGGRLVFPLPGEAAGAGEAQLLVPDEHDPAVAALLTLEEAEPLPGALEIRWEIYHGRAESSHWVIGTIEALRHHGEPFDSGELELTDALVADEPALCRELNADSAGLGSLCEAHAGARVEDPVAVGVDPDGIDVRARFGIVRVEFGSPAATVEDVREQLARLRGACNA